MFHSVPVAFVSLRLIYAWWRFRVVNWRSLQHCLLLLLPLLFFSDHRRFRLFSFITLGFVAESLTFLSLHSVAMRLSGITAILLGTIPHSFSKLGLSVSATGHALQQRAPTGSKSVIIEMFEWTWDSIAAECTSFIGPAGYGFVQGNSSFPFFWCIED